MTKPAEPAPCPTFRTDAQLALPASVMCRCRLHSRRRWGSALLGATLLPTALWAQDGVQGDVGRQSKFTRLVSADQVEQAATQQYGQMKREADAKDALAPASNAQLIRLRAIAERIIPFADSWNPRAKAWRWEVNLIGSKELNAFCMPGGKIAFYFGILQRLQLSDDEVAMIMGHEMAHALREHARERMAKTAATRIGASLISSLFGLGNLGDAALNMGGQLLTLKFSREDESEADLVGLDLAARAGYDPRAAISLWQKMMEANKGAPPEFMSTHPSGPSRIQDIERVLPKVLPLFERAARPPRRYSPPSLGNARRN
jgi:predicted Zn-dependent protease